jgi:HEAT repeat protein
MEPVPDAFPVMTRDGLDAPAGAPRRAFDSPVVEQRQGAADPLAATFDLLAGSPNAGALRVLASALEEPDPAVQARAATALLKRQNRAGLRALVRAYHTLAVGDDLFKQRFEQLIPALRDSLSDEWARARENAVDLVCRYGSPRVAYLLGQALGDAESTVQAKAAEGLVAWAREIGAAWRASRDSPGLRAELVGPRNALLAPLWEAFRTFDRHRSESVLAALIHLDPRQLVTTLSALKDAGDPRVTAVYTLLVKSAEPGVMALVYPLLEEPLTAGPALRVIHERTDLPFIRTLLDEIQALDREAVRHRLRQVTGVSWLYPGHEDLVQLKASQVGALLRFAASTSLAPVAQGALAAWLFCRVPPDGRLALVQAVGSLHEDAARPVIEGALRDADEAVELAALRVLLRSTWPDRNRLLLSCVNSPHEAARHLVMRELSRRSFRRFLEAFDRLDPTTRELAGRVIRRIDERLLDQLADELHALDPKRRFRALMVAQALHVERELVTHLIDLLRDPDRIVRATVVKVLGVVRTLEAMQAILATLNDADARVQANTIEVLADLKSERLVGLLTPFLRHPNNRVRANAARALLHLDYAPAREVLFEMLGDGSERMRLSAAWTLGQVDAPGARERLERLAAEDPSPRVRARAQQAAVRLRRQGAAHQPLMGAALHGHPQSD